MNTVRKLWSRAGWASKASLTIGVMAMSGSLLLGDWNVPEPAERLRTVELQVRPAQGPLIVTGTKVKTAKRAVELVNRYAAWRTLPEVEVRLDQKLDAMGMLEDRVIWLNPEIAKAEQVSTVLHELGHYLHFQGLDIAPVLAAAAGTGEVRELKDCAMVLDEAGEWCEYALEETELFARGFAQWIAFRSGDEQATMGVQAFGEGQWEPQDFLPVAAAFEKLLGK